MSSTTNHHQTLKNILAQRDWDAAQSLWLDLATQLSDQPDFLLVLVKEFADAGNVKLAAELAALVAPTLQAARKHHEWLFALKLQAQTNPSDKPFRADLLAAYQQIHAAEPRLPAILQVTELDRPGSNLPTAITKTDTLLALATGTYCQHKSWGFGRVKTFDTALNRIIVAFPHNPDHALQLAYAAESITPINHEHIEVRKISELDHLKQLASADPVALLRIVLLSFQRAATADQIQTALSPAVVTADQWKKWWDNAKKLAKRDKHIEIPARKTDRVVLRAAPVSQQDELLTAFRDAPSLIQKIKFIQQLFKGLDDIADPDLLLQEFHDGLTEAIRKLTAEKAPTRIEAALLLDEILNHQRAPTHEKSPLVAEILGNIRILPGPIDDLSAAVQKRAYAALKSSNPNLLLDNLNRLPAKALDEIADLLAQTASRVTQHIQNHTASLELLHWLCKNITAAKPPAWMESLSRHALLTALINAIEDSDTRSATKKVRDLLLTDETLITDLLAHSSTDAIRDFVRQLLVSTAFEELDRRSLMARIVKEFPFVQELLVSKTTKEQALVVSYASYEKRRAELDELVTKKIPQNSKEIGVARSYGDLRENFEFKAAKDMQKLLMRRRAELELMLTRATPTNFAEVSTDSVNIGTTVTVTDLATSQSQTYHILGAWDGEPTRNILSYPAALAQSLLNKKVGEEIIAAAETGTLRLRLDRIEKARPEILQAL